MHAKPGVASALFAHVRAGGHPTPVCSSSPTLLDIFAAALDAGGRHRVVRLDGATWPSRRWWPPSTLPPPTATVAAAAAAVAVGRRRRHGTVGETRDGGSALPARGVTAGRSPLADVQQLPHPSPPPTHARLGAGGSGPEAAVSPKRARVVAPVHPRGGTPHVEVAGARRRALRQGNAHGWGGKRRIATRWGHRQDRASGPAGGDVRQQRRAAPARQGTDEMTRRNNYCATDTSPWTERIRKE